MAITAATKTSNLAGLTAPRFAGILQRFVKASALARQVPLCLWEAIPVLTELTASWWKKAPISH